MPFIRFLFYLITISMILVSFALWKSNPSSNLYLSFFIESVSIFFTVSFVNFAIQQIQSQKEKPLREEGTRRCLEIYQTILEAWELLLKDTLIYRIRMDRISAKQKLRIFEMVNENINILDQNFCGELCGEINFPNSDIVDHRLSVARISLHNSLDKIDVETGRRHSSFTYIYYCMRYCKKNIERTLLIFSNALPTDLFSAMVALERCKLFDEIEFSYRKFRGNPEKADKLKAVTLTFDAVDFAHLLFEMHLCLSVVSQEFSMSDPAEALLSTRNESMKQYLFESKMFHLESV